MLKSINYFLNIQLLKPSNFKILFKDILRISNPIMFSLNSSSYSNWFKTVILKICLIP